MSCGRDPWEIIVQRAPRSIEWAIRSLGRKDLGGSWVDFPVIVFRRYSLTAGAVAFAHLEDSVPVIPRLRGGFHCLFPLSCFVVSCQPGQAAVRKVPARALWLEVLRRTWDATRCASKVRSQMTDGPHGYLRSDTNDTMLTLVFAWFRRSVALKLCILFASLQSLDVSWPSVVICGDLWCELLSGASIRWPSLCPNARALGLHWRRARILFSGAGTRGRVLSVSAFYTILCQQTFHAAGPASVSSMGKTQHLAYPACSPNYN